MDYQTITIDIRGKVTTLDAHLSKPATMRVFEALDAAKAAGTIDAWGWKAPDKKPLDVEGLEKALRKLTKDKTLDLGRHVNFAFVYEDNHEAYEHCAHVTSEERNLAHRILEEATQLGHCDDGQTFETTSVGSEMSGIAQAIVPPLKAIFSPGYMVDGDPEGGQDIRRLAAMDGFAESSDNWDLLKLIDQVFPPLLVDCGKIQTGRVIKVGVSGFPMEESDVLWLKANPSEGFLRFNFGEFEDETGLDIMIAAADPIPLELLTDYIVKE